MACGAIAAGPKLTWSKDGTRVAGLETADTDALIAAALAEGFGAFAVRMPLYNPTFSRTVWRLYGGAKGLVMWYYRRRWGRPTRMTTSLGSDPSTPRCAVKLVTAE